eukprot:CAMPEP_0183732274 /NCGR_PEP_ID=MMETSP0737-20130205/38047_1 /TAXON_ID=385413 /ORGANISM="Thalassiosira miniscula, Strain CCMP1093" /LENGTH=108 /DNA_ID=CAMNT_0025965245 /DNA_START=24 /DNA_END=350 /DNA_ORIENTATION=+
MGETDISSVSTTTCASNGANTHETKRRDPFLFYSNPDNLRRGMSLPGHHTTNANSIGTQQYPRKMRISFEKDMLSLMMDVDEDLYDEFRRLDVLLLDRERKSKSSSDE